MKIYKCVFTGLRPTAEKPWVRFLGKDVAEDGIFKLSTMVIQPVWYNQVACHAPSDDIISECSGLFFALMMVVLSNQDKPLLTNYT